MTAAPYIHMTDGNVLVFYSADALPPEKENRLVLDLPPEQRTIALNEYEARELAQMLNHYADREREYRQNPVMRRRFLIRLERRRI